MAYAGRAEPGSLGAEVVNIPQTLDVQAVPCRGSMQALESHLMLSPLPVEVTAQKPSDVPSCRGFRFWAVAKACPNHNPEQPRLNQVERHKVKKCAVPEHSHFQTPTPSPPLILVRRHRAVRLLGRMSRATACRA